MLLQAALAAIIAAALVALSYAIGRRVKNKVKDMAYECGIAPTGDARERFSVKFYLVAMLFIVFDIEAIFLYPWAVVYKQLKMFAFVEMLVFVILILAGFFFMAAGHWQRLAACLVGFVVARVLVVRLTPSYLGQVAGHAP